MSGCKNCGFDFPERKAKIIVCGWCGKILRKQEPSNPDGEFIPIEEFVRRLEDE